MAALATVTGTAPLQVALDGAGAAQPATALNGFSPAAGARVVVLLVGSLTYVIGAA